VSDVRIEDDARARVVLFSVMPVPPQSAMTRSSRPV
jgi:hypothetical protein